MASTTLRKRRLGRPGLEAAEIGFGAMGITIAYGEADPAGGAAAIRRAYELGVTLFDTAALALTADDLAEIARILPRGGFGARLPEGRVPVWE